VLSGIREVIARRNCATSVPAHGCGVGIVEVAAGLKLCSPALWEAARSWGSGLAGARISSLPITLLSDTIRNCGTLRGTTASFDGRNGRLSPERHLEPSACAADTSRTSD